jgi:hypothetical protein
MLYVEASHSHTLTWKEIPGLINTLYNGVVIWIQIHDKQRIQENKEDI